MPAWIIAHLDGHRERIEADHCEHTDTEWAWWTVVLIVNDPRWACVRRIRAGDVLRVHPQRRRPPGDCDA